MRYLIIGMGIYGSNLARDLTDQGHEVIGTDIKQSNIEAIKDYISTVYIIDSTDESSLAMLPLKNVDLVIVAIGENFGASVKTVALLLKLGVKHLYARAVDEIHESILRGFGIERILTPEQRAAADLTHEMMLGFDIESMKIDSDTFIIKFAAPEFFMGLSYKSLELKEKYGITLITAARPVARRNLIGVEQTVPETLDISSPDTVVEKGDMMVCLGRRNAYKEMYRHIS